jgi:hypothetical protein
MIVYNGWEIYVKSASKRIGPLVLEIHNIGNEYFWDLMPFETPSDDTWELHGKSSTFEKAQAAAEAMAKKLR